MYDNNRLRCKHSEKTNQSRETINLEVVYRTSIDANVDLIFFLERIITGYYIIYDITQEYDCIKRNKKHDKILITIFTETFCRTELM